MLDNNPSLGAGGTGMYGKGPGTVEWMVRELQLKRTVILAGTTATTNIALAGALLGDSIITVLHNSAGVFVDLTAEASITSDGNIQLSTTDTTGDELHVTWTPKPERTEDALVGAAVDTNIAVAGIRTGDTIIEVSIDPAASQIGGKRVIVTDEASITSDGNIQLTTTVTTGETLKIVWAPAII